MAKVKTRRKPPKRALKTAKEKKDEKRKEKQS
jgi:hypothetical protein